LSVISIRWLALARRGLFSCNNTTSNRVIAGEIFSIFASLVLILVAK